MSNPSIFHNKWVLFKNFHCTDGYLRHNEMTHELLIDHSFLKTQL